MPDWTEFHQALIAGTRPAELANACARAWRWLDLPADQRQQQIKATIGTEADAKWTIECLPLLRRRLWRDAGFDPDDTVRLGTFFEEAGAGHISVEQLTLLRRVDAATAIGHAIVERFPAAVSSGAVDRAALAEQVPALSQAVQATGFGIATPESLVHLRAAIDQFTPVGASFLDDVRREHAWWLGLAWWALGRGMLDWTRYTDAVDAFERSACWYDHADDSKAATDCRRQIRALRVRLAGDLDAAVAPSARALVEASDPWLRAAALTAFLREVGAAGDRFEAGRLAEEAARALLAAGFPDPELRFHTAVEQWVTSAAVTRTGTALFARLCEAADCWAAILGARASARLERDPDASARAERALRGLAAFPIELETQAQQARRSALERQAVWLPQPRVAANSASAQAGSADVVNAMAQLDDDIHALRLACNEAPGAHLVSRACALQQRAEALGSRVHATRAMLERAHVLLALGQNLEIPALVDATLETLLAGHPPRLGSFATRYERELYLTAIDYKARALAARKDAKAIVELCEPVIRDVESERRMVSAPYQQSAFLATRTGLYEIVAAAASHAGREDLLLTIPELLKAPAALRRLLTPESTRASADGANTALRAVGDALRVAVPGSAEETALRDRRRWLSTLAVSDRGRQTVDPPRLSLPAIQAALSPDEATVSWFWAAHDVLLVHAITPDASSHTTIELDALQQQRLRDYVDCTTALSDASPRYGRLVPELETLVVELGPVLLPPQIRDVISSRSRLVLSPHRTLHLFPFHAIVWRAGDARTEMPECRLIERFSVRYTPNLTNLLIPWHGVTRGSVLAVGVGRFDDPAVRPLPAAEDEATAVAGIHGRHGRTLHGATRSQFVDAAQADCRCLHIATHGSSVLRGDALDDPLEACLSLRDGSLSGWDLIDLRLHAELVVLGACHSGQRAVEGRGMQWLPGDDILGLQSVLFDAGAGAILGSLWAVDDETARAILLGFHSAYARGATPDKALQAATLAYLADPKQRRDTFYWAAFFLSTLGRRPDAGDTA